VVYAERGAISALGFIRVIGCRVLAEFASLGNHNGNSSQVMSKPSGRGFHGFDLPLHLQSRSMILSLFRSMAVMPQ
jgi:hypothetical protein